MMVRRVANETTAEFCRHIGYRDWLPPRSRTSHDAAPVLPD
jgi:hypothetical protein